MTYAIRLFIEDLDDVREWVEDNLNDMREDDTYFFTNSQGLVYIHFVSQQDAWDFEENYENA